MSGPAQDTKRLALSLPGHLGEMARRGHGGAALKLLQEWGGTKRYIPAHPRPGSPLVEIVGMEAAQVLADLCGSTDYDIPSRAWLGGLGATQKAAILRAEGGTREVAEALGCSERYVRMVRDDTDTQPAFGTRRRRRPTDERQIDILDWLTGAPSPSPTE